MNKLKKNLVLTGMMGSGKTTIGKYLSQRLEMGFADIDAIIEKKSGLSISEIFEMKGEKAFREEEEKESKKILKKLKLLLLDILYFFGYEAVIKYSPMAGTILPHSFLSKELIRVSIDSGLYFNIPIIRKLYIK